MTPSSNRERERGVAQLFARDRWHLAETLLWIAFRDASAMIANPTKADRPERWGRTGAGSLIAEITLGVRRATETIEQSPADALEKALVAGAVVATGRLVHQGIVGNRAPIGDEQWEDFELIDGTGEHERSTVAYPKRHLWGASVPAAFWIDILFDRKGVHQAFPAPSGNRTAKDERAAERALRAAAAAHQANPASEPAPVGAVWAEEAPDSFGISHRGAKRVWGIVAADFPFLSDPKGKAKRRTIS